VGQTFDLRPVRDVELRTFRAFRLLLAVLFAATSLLWFVTPVLALVGRVSFDPFAALGAVLSGGFGCLFIILIFAMGPGAESIDVQRGALVLHYARRTKRIDLTRPGQKLTIWTYPEGMFGGSSSRYARQVLAGVFPIRNPLTQEAYDSIMSMAHERGLRVRDTLPWGSNPLRDRCIIRLSVPR